VGSRACVAASSLLLGAALAGAAFGAASGTELTRTTVVEVLLVLAGGVVIVAAILYGRPGHLDGATALVAFGVLAAFTALAVLWSIVPELTYVEAGRTFTYLTVFAAGICAARLAPRAAPVVLGGISLAALATVLYALASRVWPGALAENELSNRIGQPFEYWNAVGAAAAMVVPGALWLATRRAGSAVSRAAAYPALGAAVVAIQLTQSRGALLAALVGALLWLALVPLRLRSLAVLVLPAAAGVLVGAWALSKDPFSKPLQPLAAKESVAGEFGLLLALMIVGLFLAGLVVNAVGERGVPPLRMHRRIGVAAAVVACAIPLVAFTSVAFSDRGIGDRLSDLTSETSTAPAEGAGRIAATSNTRGKYWREAGRVFDERPVVGTGPGTFEVARLRARTDTAATAHAHGFVPQALADTGVVGTGLWLLLLLAWLTAALRTTALLPRPRRRGGEPAPRRDWTPDRIALVALALVAITFGVQSAIDWTWFVPAIAAMALVAAGFVAGRGPAAALAGAPALAAGDTAAQAPAPSRPGDPTAHAPRPRRPDRARIAGAAAVGLLTLLCAWTIWQPEASNSASNDALDLIEAGKFDAAAAKARDAADANPLSPQPLWVEAAAQLAGGDRRAAGRTLERAVLRYPGDPETWLRLGRYQLDTLDQPREALSTVRGALYLDPKGRRAGQLFLDARVKARDEALSKAQSNALRDAGGSASAAPTGKPAKPAPSATGGDAPAGSETTPGGLAAPSG
jgi:O-antigen ligase/polysaccharide polymerase Wzy-like membrane protein